jgi:hypothetical protein
VLALHLHVKKCRWIAFSRREVGDPGRARIGRILSRSFAVCIDLLHLPYSFSTHSEIQSCGYQVIAVAMYDIYILCVEVY